MIIQPHHYHFMDDFTWACKDIMIKDEADGLTFFKEFLNLLFKASNEMTRDLYIHEMLDVCKEFTGEDAHHIKARMKSIYELPR
jgi:hypothetical protein